MNLKQDPKNSVIMLVDSTIDLPMLKSKRGTKIITFDFKSHKFLTDNKIIHQISDEYITNKELNYIQKFSYQISRWHEDKDIKKIFSYEGVNIGELFYRELSWKSLLFLKRIITIKNIVEKHTLTKFLSSENLFNITKQFTNFISKLKSTKQENTLSSLDFIDIPISIPGKKTSLRLKYSNFNKLKKTYDKILQLSYKSSTIDTSYKTVLFVDFTTVRYEKLFSILPKFKLNLVKFDTKIPAFWNRQSYSLIKRSKCIVENYNNLMDKNTKKLIQNELKNISNIMTQLYEHEKYFERFFSFTNFSFWHVFNPFFFDLCRKNLLDAIPAIILIKKLLNKYNFSSIVIWNETEFTEQIVIQLAKKSRISLCLLQHGLYYLTPERYDFENFGSLFSKKSDYFLAWGQKEAKYAIEIGIKPTKIKKIGCPFYDQIFNVHLNDNESNDFILLAADSPNLHTVHETTIDVREKYEQVIKRVCQVTSKLNKPLIIKLHPSKYLSEDKIAKSIDPKIKIIKTGSIIPLIQSCQVMLVINLSSTILEAQILKKPVISISTYTHNGNPEIFTSNSCISTTIDKFEESFLRILNDSLFKQSRIDVGQRYVDEHLSNPGIASESLLTFLTK